jgi:hypothetical protein
MVAVREEPVQIYAVVDTDSETSADGTASVSEAQDLAGKPADVKPYRKNQLTALAGIASLPVIERSRLKVARVATTKKARELVNERSSFYGRRRTWTI